MSIVFRQLNDTCHDLTETVLNLLINRISKCGSVLHCIYDMILGNIKLYFHGYLYCFFLIIIIRNPSDISTDKFFLIRNQLPLPLISPIFAPPYNINALHINFIFVYQKSWKYQQIIDS